MLRGIAKLGINVATKSLSLRCVGISVSAFATAKYYVPDLPYDYAALEPVISTEIMKLHHDKHHASYVTNLNKALEQYEDAVNKQDLNMIVTLQKQIKFNGGGHINHSIFWNNLAPKDKGGGVLTLGPLRTKIETQFGTLENLQSLMSDLATTIQGSGWAWMGYDKAGHRLALAYTKNQTPLQAKHGLVPLLGIDVWEHAYYPQYKNSRPDYVKKIWEVINWADVADRFEQAVK